MGILNTEDFTPHHENLLQWHALFQQAPKNQVAVKSFSIMHYKNISPLSIAPEMHKKIFNTLQTIKHPLYTFRCFCIH